MSFRMNAFNKNRTNYVSIAISKTEQTMFQMTFKLPTLIECDFITSDKYTRKVDWQSGMDT